MYIIYIVYICTSHDNITNRVMISAALASAVKPRVCWARPPHVQWQRFSAVAQSIPGLEGPHGSSV